MYRIIALFLSIFSIGFGSWCIKSPKRVIGMQIAFYRRINWRMEPVDWNLETRNTRLMGFLALICGAIGFLCMAL